MKLFVKETNWWGWDEPGQKVTNYEYDLENMKKGDKVVVSTTKILHVGDSQYVDEPNLYFIFVSKRKDRVKLKIGSHMPFNKKNFSRKPLAFWIKEGQTLYLDSNTMDAGMTYSISLNTSQINAK